jgi:hypothetical protein
VREKRLALEGEARGDTPPTPAEDKVTVDPERQAKDVARSMFATSNYEYGSRGSLELFGVAQVTPLSPGPWSPECVVARARAGWRARQTDRQRASENE